MTEDIVYPEEWKQLRYERERERIQHEWEVTKKLKELAQQNKQEPEDIQA